MCESENFSHNCRECGSDCAERREPQSFLEEPNAGTHVKKVIGIVSGKGGVGKSLLGDGFVKETQRFSDYLPDVCLMIEKDELAEAIIHAGIQRHQAHVLIKALKYENYNTQ